jgi:hypothetical protein
MNSPTAEEERALSFAPFNTVATLERDVLMMTSLYNETLADFILPSELCVTTHLS